MRGAFACIEVGHGPRRLEPIYSKFKFTEKQITCTRTVLQRRTAQHVRAGLVDDLQQRAYRDESCGWIVGTTSRVGPERPAEASAKTNHMPRQGSCIVLVCTPYPPGHFYPGGSLCNSTAELVIPDLLPRCTAHLTVPTVGTSLQ